MDGPSDLSEDNARLKQQLEDLQRLHKQEQLEMESKLKKAYGETVQQKNAELDTMRNRMARLTRQLDEEVTRRDHVQAESMQLERKVHELTEGGEMSVLQQPPSTSASNKGSKISFEKERTKEEEDRVKQITKERGAQVSTKLMRVVDQCMRQKDLRQAWLRGAGVNDTAFSTLAQVLADCPSLQTLDLGQNQLTMDSSSGLCQLITTAPNLSFVGLAENMFTLRSVGYFMTAVMERQGVKKLQPLDLLDLQGNEGIIAAANAPPPEGLLRQVNSTLGVGKLPPRGAELVAQLMRTLWRFLHDTNHPQIRGTNIEEVSFQSLEKKALGKMENALIKILLQGVEEDGRSSASADGDISAVRSVTANLALLSLLEAPAIDEPGPLGSTGQREEASRDERRSDSANVHLPPIEGSRSSPNLLEGRGAKDTAKKLSRTEPRDPFSDLKSAFEPPKKKATTFSSKSFLSKSGMILTPMLERTLETTEINHARDQETGYTLLEFACHRGDMSLAKLCKRKGAKLSKPFKNGDTAFHIATRNKRYDMMEFLHMYGVQVDLPDANGKTALHIAAANNDVDAVCRLLEWGADVNMRDAHQCTPIHTAAAGGYEQVTTLLLEVGADMNAKDDKNFTAVAHAEAHNHFDLMKRLKQLGGHGLHQRGSDLVASKSMKSLGELTVKAGQLRSSSLGRIGKVPVSGLPGPIPPPRDDSIKAEPRYEFLASGKSADGKRGKGWEVSQAFRVS